MIRGVAWNLSGMVAIALTMLATTPLFLQHFGAERYGVLATIWVVFGYFSVLDFGMGPAVVSFLSRSDRQEREGASGVFWTALLMNLVMGLAVAVVLLAMFALAGRLGWLPEGVIGAELRHALPWLLAMLPVSLVYPILVGTLDARQQFGIANANQVAGTVASQALPLLAVILVRPTLGVAVAGTVAGRLLSALLLLYFCVRQLDLTAPRFERALIRELTSFGGWVALSAAVGSILDTIDRLVVTSFLGGVAAAWYAISYNVVTRARVLPQAIARTLYPQVAMDPVIGQHALARSARVMVLVLVPAFAFGMVLLDPLCRLWIGASAAAAVVPVAQVMLLGIYANCLAFIPVVALQARGEPGRLARLHLWETPIFLAVMIVATWRFGIAGAVVSWSTRLVVDSILLLWVTGMRRILLIDVLAQSMLPVLALLIAVLLPGDWLAKTGIVVLLVVGWAVIDTVLARRGDGLSLLTIARWLHLRLIGACERSLA